MKKNLYIRICIILLLLIVINILTCYIIQNSKIFSESDFTEKNINNNSNTRNISNDVNIKFLSLNKSYLDSDFKSEDAYNKLQIRVLIKNKAIDSNFYKSVSFKLNDENIHNSIKVEIISGDNESYYLTNSVAFNWTKENYYILSIGNNKIKLDDSSYIILGLLQEKSNKGIYINDSDNYYSGKIFVSLCENGLTVVNELCFEDYIKAVVSSEMPASFSTEAMKAQAVLARTFAYKYILNPALTDFGANLDDSVMYQAYNYSVCDIKVREVVDSTKGFILANEDLANVQYYSTDCGSKYIIENYNYVDFSDNNDFNAYLSEEGSFEKADVFYPDIDASLWRWSYEVGDLDNNCFRNNLCKIAKNTNSVFEVSDDLTNENLSKNIKNFKHIYSLFVDKRDKLGRVISVFINTDKGFYRVYGELSIRELLYFDNGILFNKNNSIVENLSMLPSAYFCLFTSKKNKNVVGFNLLGGGFGHGNGMSQYGANGFAKTGADFKDILNYYYKDYDLKVLYE